MVSPDAVDTAMSAVKVIKVMGTSESSWEDAAEEALRQASNTVDDASGIEVKSWTAAVDDNEIAQYKATVEITFPVHE